MKLNDALKLVNDLMNKNYIVYDKTYNIIKTGWIFGGFDNAVRRIGVCRHGRGKNEICLSRKMTENLTKNEIEQVILHEIAHAIDFEYRNKSNHDSTWLSISRQIGYLGERTTKVSSDVILSTYKWVATCEEHGVLTGFSRKPTNNKICKKCGKRVNIMLSKDFKN